VLLATPVYRGSMTGTLKNRIDHIPTEAPRRKPVAILAIGASDHHYLGADRHLRDVLSFFGALVCPTSCYLSSRDFEDGEVTARAALELDETIAAALTLAPAGVGPLGPDPLGARAR
jgi:FMN reductase